jgi:hypothetical protein
MRRLVHTGVSSSHVRGQTPAVSGPDVLGSAARLVVRGRTVWTRPPKPFRTGEARKVVAYGG